MKEYGFDQFEPVPACPVCGSPDRDLMEQPIFRDFELRYQLCRECGLVYQSPRISEAALDDFYQHEYRRIYQGQEEVLEKDLQTQDRRADHLIEFIREKIASPCSVLDIGCSTGMLLNRLQDDLGCAGMGVEPGKKYREYAAGLGLDVHPSVDDVIESFQGAFDVVIMAHVLEHLPAPVTFLKVVRENLMSNNSLLLLEVPNLYGHDSYELAHFCAFSRRSLASTLLAAGFEPLETKIHGSPRSRILPLYITGLFTPGDPADLGQPGSILPEKGVKAKRKISMILRRGLQKLLPDQAWLPVQGENRDG